MAGGPTNRTTTILFTDLVNSTELMQRAGDEDAQRIFRAHYQLLRDAVSANGGAEVKSLGDGLMVEFNSAADAVRCAIVMQQTSRRAGSTEKLAIRVGINTGDALRDEGDLFGTPVVIARRLCDSARPGQIICGSVVEALLAGRQAFTFRDLGAMTLKGIAAPVTASEVVFDQEQPGVLITRTPFVGRRAEMERLQQKLADAQAGAGALVFLVGEPGIGKSRTIEEVCEQAASEGATVLTGRCFEGEWAPPYGPFAEAIAGYVKDADAGALRADLGFGAPPIARLAPVLRDVLPDTGEPEPLQPDEERFRLLDAVSQFVIALSQRAPVVLVLDDLHWADRGTIAMLRHVARFASKHRILIIGAYRDVELDRQHPLSDALAQLRREAEYERIALKGLARDDVGALLQTIAEQDVNAALVQAISDETDGNPFFIREVLIHLVEEGKLYREEGQWRSDATTIADLGIPEGVRQVITRRLSRLSDAANKLMTAASAFSGGFRLQTAAAVAGLDDAAALDAIDEALEAQLLRPGGNVERYDFTHALIRHTLYGEMNPSRQVRLHRRIAEAIEQHVATSPPAVGTPHAGELAYQYHRSAAIPGAERGAQYALLAADSAEATGAWEEAVQYIEMALDMMDTRGPGRGTIVGRLAIAKAWSLNFEDAERLGLEAARLIAEESSRDAAADFLAQAAFAVGGGGDSEAEWRLSAAGLEYLSPDRRDATWVQLTISDIANEEAHDPDNPGVPLPNPRRDEVARFILSQSDPHLRRHLYTGGWMLHPSRTAAEAAAFLERETANAGDIEELRASVWSLRGVTGLFLTGDIQDGMDAFREMAVEYERKGAIAISMSAWAQVIRGLYALGDLAEGDRLLEKIRQMGQRVSNVSVFTLQLSAAEDERRQVYGEWATGVELGSTIESQQVVANRWAESAIVAAFARGLARIGQPDVAVGLLSRLIQTLQLAPGNAANYARVASNAAETLWVAHRVDHLDIIERALLDKVIAPGAQYVNVDARLDVARLCAVSGRLGEASDWFTRARAALEQQGARPMRAICDHDEALMYVRRSADGDRDRARPLLDAALAQFRTIGMTGWARSAQDLLASINAA